MSQNHPASLPFAVLALADAPRWQTADAKAGMAFAFAAARLAREASAVGVPVALWLRAHNLTVQAWQQWLDRVRFVTDVGLPVVISAPVVVGNLPDALQPLPDRAPQLLGVQVPEAQRARWSTGQAGALRLGALQVGFACHDAGGVAAAAALGASWATVSPVWPTPRKPDAAALGEAGLRALVASAGLPLVALGGIGPAQVASAAAAGAAAVAADSGLWDNPQAFLAAVAACDWQRSEARQGS